MSLNERLAHAERVRRAQRTGQPERPFPVIEDDPDPPDEEASPGRACPSCGSDGRIDLVDLNRSQAYLTCVPCGETWESSSLGDDLSGPRPMPQPRLRD